LTFKNVCIPKEEQLEAISNGLVGFYALLQRYLDDLNASGDLRRYLDITKSELITYLRNHPALMKKHLHSRGSHRYHEQVILEYDGKKYRVYEMDHDEPIDIKEYTDFAEAMADYLIYNLGLPPGFFKNI